MRAFSIFPLSALSLAGCTGTVEPAQPALSDERACAEGQTATEGSWDYTEDLTQWWAQLDGRFSAVLARRVTEVSPSPISADDAAPVDDNGLTFIECTVEARYEIIDGLGWVDAEEIRVRGRTSQGYFGRHDGTPVATDLRISEHFYDPNYESMAPDDEVYILFVLPRPDGSYLLRRRAQVTGEMVSGQHTESGEDAPLELFRR